MNITIAEMYQFLGILLKMSLIFLVMNSFKSLWYSPTHASISPTCQFVIKDYPSWTKIACLIQDFFKYVQNSIKKAGQAKNGINIIN